MTHEEVVALRQSMPIVSALFANGDGTPANPPAWNDPSANEAGSRVINWSEGIPPDYAMPYANSGKKVLRKDINAIGNIASRELYLLQHGGYHTFDDRVADAIGGYPNGAILDWYQESTGWLRKVRCVKEGGNCFTPIDDPDHGVGSGEAHWEIADTYDAYISDDSPTASIDTRAAPMPLGGWGGAFWGGYCLEIQKGTSIASGDTAMSEAWTAPFNSLVSFPFVRTGRATLYDDSELVCFNPYMYAFQALYTLDWYLEIGRGDQTVKIPLFQNVTAVNDNPLQDSTFRNTVESMYSLIPRLFLKQGDKMRFCCKNNGSDSATLSCAYFKFDLSEVV